MEDGVLSVVDDDDDGVLGGGVLGATICSVSSLLCFVDALLVALKLDEGGGIGNIRSCIPTCAHNAGRTRFVNPFRLITKVFSVGMSSFLILIFSFEMADFSFDMLRMALFSENCANTCAETRCVV